MDANGLRFWMLADEKQWTLHGVPPDLQYDKERRSLRLVSRSPNPQLGNESIGAEAEALDRINRVPQTRDAYETRAYWDSGMRRVMATGALPSSIPIYRPAPDETPTDLAMGYDGVLYMAINGGVVMLDRLGRWQPVTLRLAGFSTWRLAANPAGGVWALDRDTQQLARVQGLPLRDRPHADYDLDTFRPVEENPDPPRMEIVASAAWEGTDTPVAIASSAGGKVAVLSWSAGNAANVRYLGDSRTWSAPTTLNGALHPYSLAWASEDRIAVLVLPLKTEAPVYPAIEGVPATDPVGDFYPLREHNGEPFMRGVTFPVHYPSDSPGEKGSRPLLSLSLPTFPAQGEASSTTLIDSGNAQTVWHRLYLEAMIPAKCGVRVFLATSDEQADVIDALDWHEHQFGAIFSAGGPSGKPRGAWMPQKSEIPFHPGLISCDQEPNRAGLFTVLVQRAGRRVRTLRGRYLHVRIVLSGDGRTTPEVWALRAYGSRFSYLDHYLPELYRESVFGADADAPGSSTPADFLERFLDNFEGILTPLEDRIAQSYLLTDPRTTQQDALGWLGSWIGVSFDTAYPMERQRRLIAAAPQLFKQRGTLAGLKLALNVATGGAVDSGEIIILEDWKLRRTFATILGADLADEDDPLLAGIAVSGNSYVGDTLFLGDENRKEFLALFAADLEISLGEAKAIEALFDQLAFRVTILVHNEVEPQDMGLIRRIVEMEVPAHLITRVVPATAPFLVGMAALVGVDTYLAEGEKARPVRVDVSYVGVRDVLQRPPSLDPRLEGGWDGDYREVLADPGDDQIVEAGTSFILDASGSIAVGGQIARYEWTLVEIVEPDE
jgi:phage tail-like protein